MPEYEQKEYLLSQYSFAFDSDEVNWLSEQKWAAKYLIAYAEETGGSFNDNPGRPNLGAIGNFIRRAVFHNSGFDQRMFERFWIGSGQDYHMNFDEYWSIVQAYQNYGIVKERQNNRTWVGKQVDAIMVDFTPSYPSPYSFSLGNCTIYVQPDGNTDIAIGFFDEYNFDPRRVGERARGFLAEWLVKNANNSFPKAAQGF